MLAGLLKCPKAHLEVARDPWPKYSRKLTLQHGLARIFNSSPQSMAWELIGVDMWPKLSNLESSRETHT